MHFRILERALSKKYVKTPFTRDLDQIGSTSIRILLDPIPEVAMRLHGIRSGTICVYTGTDPDEFNRLRAYDVV